MSVHKSKICSTAWMQEDRWIKGILQYWKLATFLFLLWLHIVWVSDAFVTMEMVSMSWSRSFPLHSQFMKAKFVQLAQSLYFITVISKGIKWTQSTFGYFFPVKQRPNFVFCAENMNVLLRNCSMFNVSVSIKILVSSSTWSSSTTNLNIFLHFFHRDTNRRLSLLHHTHLFKKS